MGVAIWSLLLCASLNLLTSNSQDESDIPFALTPFILNILFFKALKKKTHFFFKLIVKVTKKVEHLVCPFESCILMLINIETDFHRSYVRCASTLLCTCNRIERVKRYFCVCIQRIFYSCHRDLQEPSWNYIFNGHWSAAPRGAG